MNVTGRPASVGSSHPIDWSTEIMKIKAVPHPMHVEVFAGDVDQFAKMLDKEIGLVDPTRDTSSLTFCDVPIRKSELLPANMAAMMVNGELVQLFKFD